MSSPDYGNTVSSYSGSGDRTIDALLGGTKWGGPVGSTATISYSFPTFGSTWSTITFDGYGPPGGFTYQGDYYLGEPWWSGYGPLASAQQADFEAALGLWAEVADITFVELTETANDVGDIRVAYSGAVTADPTAAAWAYLPFSPFGNGGAGDALSGDIWVDPNYSKNLETDPGQYGFYVYLHELGHAIGLDHPFDGPYTLSGVTSRYSVMAYTKASGTTIWPTGPMLYDILAIQYLYGPNMTTRTGDDIYTYSNTEEVLTCIWDAGGIDTLDASNQSRNAIINLVAGEANSIGVRNDGITASKNVFIAYGATIENANGGSGNDSITGNDVANVLNGNGGNDTINGGVGDDTMAGGAGDDTFTVDSVGDVVDESAGGGTDTVKSSADFVLGDDIEKLILTGTASIDGTGNALNNTITGTSGANRLDGGAGIDTLAGGLGNDVYVIDNALDKITEASGGGKDTVESSLAGYILAGNIEDLLLLGGAVSGTGNTLANAITGNSGANVIDGGAGADTLIGGDGNDTYIVAQATDVVSELFDEGEDTVKSAVSYILGSNIEDLILTGTAGSKGTGNDLGNDITGNNGANVIDGGAGDDSMAGGLGNDSYVVDAAGDGVSESAAAGTDTVRSYVDYTLGANLEKLVLQGSADIDGMGNDLKNTLTGNAGANRLDGGEGVDTMVGGLGNDIFVVRNLGDKVTEGANGGIDTVESYLSYVLATNLEHLVLMGSTNINGTGNSANNSLTGNGGDNILDGKLGNDSMIGGEGNDTYIVNVAGDVVTETGVGDIDTVKSAVGFILDPNLEHLVLTGSAAIAGTGNAFGNAITGNSGANTLTGNGGNDTLNGGAGNDILIGGDGDDTYMVNAAGDVVTETDIDDLDTVQSSVAYTLGATLENLTLIGTGGVAGTGNGLANIIVGNTAANKLYGLDGNDTLDGGKGADILYGGAGADIFLRHSIAEGKDTIFDFLTGPGGDVLDIGDLLIGFVPGSESEFVQCVASGANTIVKVDVDGGVDNFVDLCVLTGVTTTLDNLLSGGNIDLASP